MRNKLPENVLEYLRIDVPDEENLPTFGKDVKIYSVEEVASCLNNIEEALTNWSSPSSNLDSVAKKDISFKWKESNASIDTKIFEVPVKIQKRRCKSSDS